MSENAPPRYVAERNRNPGPRGHFDNHDIKDTEDPIEPIAEAYSRDKALRIVKALNELNAK
jgi:hypothetical protein